MNIKKLQLLCTICLLFVVIKYTKCSESKKKHVVFIVADDLGWNDVSFHGSNQFVTPNIDALAYSGVILKNYYVLPLCSPSRSALMSGLHPIKTGMYHYVLLAAQPTGLPLDIKILPQYMKDYGYKTHAVGKWHLGFCKESYTPTKRGFDTHFGYWTGHEAYFDHRAEVLAVKMIGNDFRRGMDNISYEYQGQYATDLFTDEAVNVINSHNTTEPLFLYLAHLAVHSANKKDPLQAPKEIIDKFSYIEDVNRRIFAAMVWKLDESVGKVVQALSQKNMLEDTIIIFSTDNGGPAADYDQNVASNWPLRGIKDTLWEGGVRGASFIWSADLPHSTTNSALMHIQDWLPTILGAIGEQPAELLDLDGRNMWPVLKGEKESEYDEIILQRDDIRRIAALRKDNWKVIKGIVYGGKYDKCFGPTGRDEKYAYNITAVSESPVAIALQTKFPFPKEDQILSIRRNVTLKCDICDINNNSCIPCNLKKGPCLFDVSNDACEQNDLSQKYPDILKDLLSRVDTYKPVRPRFPLIALNANPIYWNNTWTNWLDYEGSESSRGPQIAFNMLEKQMMWQD